MPLSLNQTLHLVNKLIEQRAKEKVSSDKSVALEETVPAKINRFWSENDTKCRAFWVVLVVWLIMIVLMRILLNHAIISVFIASCAIIKTLFKLMNSAKQTD